jgi:putative transposase
MALLRRRAHVRPILRSDRASQYCAKVYQQLLIAAGIIAYMSRRYKDCDRIPMESFWNSLKNELIHQKTYLTRQTAIDEILEYAEIFYNRQRRHTCFAMALKQCKLRHKRFLEVAVSIFSAGQIAQFKK